MNMLAITLVLGAMMVCTWGDSIAAEQKEKGQIEIRTIAKSPSDGYYAFPSVCRMQNGDLVCVFYSGTAHVCPDSKIAMVRSTDDGKTWSTPATIVDTPMDDRDPSIMQTRTGRLLVSFFTRDSGNTGSAKQSNKVLVAASDDGGKTFGTPKPIGTYWRWEATSDEILQLPDGTLLLPIYGCLGSDKSWRAGVVFSHDNGDTWSRRPMTIAHDRRNNTIRFEEPALAQFPDGTILCALRTSNADHHIYEVISKDGGKTWSSLSKLPLRGQASGLLYHSSGRLFQAYRDCSLPDKQRGVAGIFRTAMEQWNPEKQFSIIRSSNWDIAYPSSVELGDGCIMTVYYVREHQTIEAAVFTPQAIKALSGN